MSSFKDWTEGEADVRLLHSDENPLLFRQVVADFNMPSGTKGEVSICIGSGALLLRCAGKNVALTLDAFVDSCRQVLEDVYGEEWDQEVNR